MNEYAILLQDATNDYGVLALVVSIAGSLIAASGAIGFSWKRRAKWEPVEEDIPQGAQKVVGLLSAVVIAVLWATSGPGDENFLAKLALWLVGLCVIFLLLYGYLIALQIYEKIVAKDGKPIPQKVIGGYRLTDNAKKEIKKKTNNTGVL